MVIEISYKERNWIRFFHLNTHLRSRYRFSIDSPICGTTTQAKPPKARRLEAELVIRADHAQSKNFTDVILIQLRFYGKAERLTL
jgi:hypothetical protein